MDLSHPGQEEEWGCSVLFWGAEQHSLKKTPESLDVLWKSLDGVFMPPIAPIPQLLLRLVPPHTE
jgi:hypothetical protein